MFWIFLVNILVPIIGGLVYFFMAAEINRVSRVRKIMFGELWYRLVFNAFLMFGIYLIARPLQNVIGPYPWPMIINSMRQFFLMAVIAPAVLVGILHWVPSEKPLPKSAVVASYVIGTLIAVIFILVNYMAIDGSHVLATFGGMTIYDAVWFSKGPARLEIVLIHLICQLISPVGFFLLAAAYVRHRRHIYPLGNIYNLMPLKWRYLEAGILIIGFSFIMAGIAALFGQYYTYLWVIYFSGAIIAGLLELKGVKLPPREAPKDIQEADNA
jgi:hypothetical protein